MLELLVHPYRQLNQSAVDQYYGLLSSYQNLEWIEPNLEIADLGARIRAQHRLRTPDALLAASATWAKARGLITNDPVFTRVDTLEALVLDEMLSSRDNPV